MQKNVLYVHNVEYFAARMYIDHIYNVARQKLLHLIHISVFNIYVDLNTHVLREQRQPIVAVLYGHVHRTHIHMFIIIIMDLARW